MKRRSALKATAIFTGSSLISFSNIRSMFATDQSLGVQLFTIPSMIDKDFQSTMELISEVGYQEIELYGPYPFSCEKAKQAWAGFKGMLGLQKDAFYGFTQAQVVQILADNKLRVPSMHADIDSMRTDLSKLCDGAAYFKPQYLVVPAIMEGRDTLDDYKRLAAEFNEIGAKMKTYDMTFVYHNHGYEQAEKDGKVPMQVLIEETDPSLVSFELDVFWMQAGGGNPIDYIETYADRYRLLHLKDASETFRFSGDGSTPEEWMAGFSKMSDPGEGVFDIKGIVAAAEKVGIKHYYLERDMAPNGEATLRNSYKNLSAL